MNLYGPKQLAACGGALLISGVGVEKLSTNQSIFMRSVLEHEWFGSIV
jgi:hypothetical protein